MTVANIVIDGGQVHVTGLSDQDQVSRAVLISLFTDSRVDKTAGWWADSFSQDKIGSNLWTLKREKVTQETVQKASDYCRSALQWLLDDGVASKVDVISERIDSGGIAVHITIS